MAADRQHSLEQIAQEASLQINTEPDSEASEWAARAVAASRIGLEVMNDLEAVRIELQRLRAQIEYMETS